jgi:hypothetical protein
MSITVNSTESKRYFLSTDENGVNSWTSSVIGNNGQTNSIAVWRSSIGLTNSIIYDNGTNIGIGTASPVYKLSVIGTVSTTGFRMTNGASNGYVLTSDSNGVATWQVSSGGVGGATYTAGIGLTLSGSTFSLSTTNLRTIYVSATGSNDNNGLSTITPVLNLWKGRDLAVSGDTVVIMPGTYIFDNRNSAGCPYNGLIESKVNLWKDGVTYYFMPGTRIYSYGSTSVSYSPYSDDMVYFRPNSLTYSQCTVTGDLEFYANSEGADNSGGGHQLFDGGENNGASTYPGYTFYMNAKHIEGVTGCTPVRATRSSISTGTASIYIDVKTLKYGYTTGQSANGAFSVWRGGDNSEMIVNIRVGQLIGNGTSYMPFFQVRPYSVSGINKLRFNLDVEYASLLGHSYLLQYFYPNTFPTPTSLISSGQVNINCNTCIFSSSLIWSGQTYNNGYITITGNYYCSGSFTGKYSFFPSTYPFIMLWDQKNDGLSDNTVLDFKGNYYTNNPARTIVHVGGENTSGSPLYGYANQICNYTGDIYFAGTASNYTGTLFYVDMGKMRFSGRVHGGKNYSGYGFGGSVMRFGGSSDGFLTNAHIYSNLNSSLVSYGTPVLNQSTLTISNSFIDMTGTSSVIGDMGNLNTYVQNSTIRNRGTNDIFYNSLSTGTLQITNSTLINSSSTASTINYPLGTVIGAGAFSNKDIIFSTLNGTVSVVSGLI